MKNRSITVDEIGGFSIKEIELRPCTDHEVLLKVEITGLCRTDLKIIESGHRDLVLPRVPGEEVIGTILEKGKFTENFAINDLVYVYPGKWCGICPACKNGAHNLCETMEIMGFHRDGGFAHYVFAPVQSLIHVPEKLSPSEAVFAEPLSCCINALENGNLTKGDRVGIWGAGPAGTLLARASKLKAQSVMVFDPHPVRSKLAGAFELLQGQSFDLVIIATNSKDAYAEGFSHLAPKGRIVLFSGLTPGQASQLINLDTIHYKEQTIIGAYGCCYRHGVQALELLSTKEIEVKDLISHTLSLWDLKNGLSIVKERRGMKVLLDPWKEV